MEGRESRALSPRGQRSKKDLTAWESLYRRGRTALRSVKFFGRFLRGNFENFHNAPVIAKKALAIRRSRVSSAIALSPLPTEAEVWSAAHRAHEAVGVWPISFSYPRPVGDGQSTSRDFMCPVFPGHRYSFADEAAYRAMYGSYSFALTHKKAGWDCFRHLEILSAGSVPFMPDAPWIPEFTMVHYPKQLFVEVAEHLKDARGTVDTEVHRDIEEFFNLHLTTRAMASYLVRAAPALARGPILFVDAALADTPDYQSVLTLIGLKQLLGKTTSVSFPVDYVYEGWGGEGRSLYGRGFGYTGVLSHSVRNSNETQGRQLSLCEGDLARFGSVVIGSVTRNMALAEQLLDIFPASQTIWIHGEDEPPTQAQLRHYRASGVTVFVRELEGP